MLKIIQRGTAIDVRGSWMIALISMAWRLTWMTSKYQGPNFIVFRNKEYWMARKGCPHSSISQMLIRTLVVHCGASWVVEPRQHLRDWHVHMTGCACVRTVTTPPEHFNGIFKKNWEIKMVILDIAPDCEAFRPSTEISQRMLRQ